ncbi:hypothetical protein [Microbacterium indicum]|uniref:hypothetical protein n=1 Tax=Microbacterium indicum TaxID=358100 RepID=UPI0012EBB625|nr:hypothetical protein [Microbacterium indicum]
MIQRRQSPPASHAGAPPVPPPGGYRGERRYSDDPAFPLFARSVPAERKGASALGVVALIAAVLFAVVLAAMVFAGASHLVLGATTVVVQLLLAALVTAALVSPRARILGAVALTIGLVANVGTATAAGAVVSAQTGDYSGGMTSEQRAELQYPGIKGIDPQAVLASPSLEQRQAGMDAISDRIRDRLSAEYGFTWVQVADATSRPERNGYGGESLLQRYTAPVWRTEQAVHDSDEKRAVLQTIDDVLRADGTWWDLQGLSVPAATIGDDALTALYGSADPETQALWEYATSQMQTVAADPATAPATPLLYATIMDLDNDPTGDFRASQQSTTPDGAPLEGLDLTLIAPQQLSQDDRAEFERLLTELPIA